MVSIEIRGLDEITRSFKAFQFSGKRVQQRFLRLIGDNTVILAKDMTPRDSGELAESWRVLGQSRDTVEVGTSLIGLLRDLTEGTAPHIIEPKRAKVLRFEVGGQEVFASRVFHPGIRANPFIDDVQKIIHANVIQTLELALSENHPFFKQLSVGGKGRKFQQVGRTSAGFKGGTSFAGRATLVRPGTGRRQLKRRLSLRRRRGGNINKRQTRVDIG